MNCLLMTGATGMLGYFLLRDSLLARQNLALIVRRSKQFDSKKRIEQLVSRMERETKTILPRPIVLEGDTHQPMLGLNQPAMDWVSRNCDSFLHSAASVKFYTEGENPETEEPYLSNVVGTKNVLEFCKQVGIENYHHVSTAYVCGGQTGQVFEEQHSNAQFGNDYEATKAAAEKMVRDAGHLKNRTILRPSIIVGDVESGFSPSFHGIYTALQLGYLFLTGAVRNGISELTPQVVQAVIDGYFIEQLGLTGDERKNLVPGDWVSKSMLEIVNRSELHNQTYHITHPEPVSVRQLTESMKDAVMSYLPVMESSKTGVPNNLLALDGFKSHMDTYRAYFRNDPNFESERVQNISDLPRCPAFTNESLVKLWSFAIEHDFSPVAFRKISSTSPSTGSPLVDVAKRIECISNSVANQQNGVGANRFSLQVDGENGGAWEIGFKESRSGFHFASLGDANVSDDSVSKFLINANWFSELATGMKSVENALFSGGLLIQEARSLQNRSPIETNTSQKDLELLAQHFFEAIRIKEPNQQPHPERLDHTSATSPTNSIG